MDSIFPQRRQGIEDTKGNRDMEITVGLASIHIFLSKASDLWFTIYDVGSNLKINSKTVADFENSGLNRICNNMHH